MQLARSCIFWSLLKEFIWIGTFLSFGLCPRAYKGKKIIASICFFLHIFILSLNMALWRHPSCSMTEFKDIYPNTACVKWDIGKSLPYHQATVQPKALVTRQKWWQFSKVLENVLGFVFNPRMCFDMCRISYLPYQHQVFLGLWCGAWIIFLCQARQEEK